MVLQHREGAQSVAGLRSEGPSGGLKRSTSAPGIPRGAQKGKKDAFNSSWSGARSGPMLPSMEEGQIREEVARDVRQIQEGLPDFLPSLRALDSAAQRSYLRPQARPPPPSSEPVWPPYAEARPGLAEAAANSPHRSSTAFLSVEPRLLIDSDSGVYRGVDPRQLLADEVPPG